MRQIKCPSCGSNVDPNSKTVNIVALETIYQCKNPYTVKNN